MLYKTPHLPISTQWVNSDNSLNEHVSTIYKYIMGIFKDKTLATFSIAKQPPLLTWQISCVQLEHKLLRHSGRIDASPSAAADTGGQAVLQLSYLSFITFMIYPIQKY